jgi:hypothetical protein
MWQYGPPWYGVSARACSPRHVVDRIRSPGFDTPTDQSWPFPTRPRSSTKKHWPPLRLIVVPLAELKERLKRGGTTLKEVLDDAENVAFIGKLKVTQLLEAMPGVGVARAKQIAQRLEIAPGVRVRELSQRQRKALLAEFSGD